MNACFWTNSIGGWRYIRIWPIRWGRWVRIRTRTSTYYGPWRRGLVYARNSR